MLEEREWRDRARQAWLIASILGAALTAGSTTPAHAQRLATRAEVASFWNTVFRGASPFGVPPLAASRTNRRAVRGATVWDVTFDSYRDPDTERPVRLFGYFAIPTGATGPGPGGTFPGLVGTHSVGGCPTCSSPAEGIDTAVFYAEQGYAALAFYLRGYAPSTMSNPALNVTAGSVAFCVNMTGDGEEPFDTLWAGYPADVYQAGELVAAQPEVWEENGLAFIGHSLGGYAGVAAGIFSERYRVIAASAPPTSGSDPVAWIEFGNPVTSCADRLPGSRTTNRALAARMVSFVGVHQAINEPMLYALDPDWRLDGVDIFFYGGEVDTAVPPAGVEETYLLAAASNNKALHWSPIGGHGGPESYYRSRAWLDGHYPGIPASPPTAALTIASTSGLTVTFDASGSTDDDTMIAWDYDFGDGTRRNIGDVVTHSYASAGTYTATVTVTDGEGTRDTAGVTVTVGGVAAPEIDVGAASPVVVPEGGTATLTASLTAQPGATVSIAVARESGDTDITAAPATITFTRSNWATAQTVTLSAADDADSTSDGAVFTLGASGIPMVRVDAEEADDDAAFSLTVGSVFVRPGESVDVPVALANPDGARIRALSVTLAFDGAALGDPIMTRGPSVPDPSLWIFDAAIPSPGMQIIAGNEIAQPEGYAVDGPIATDAFAIGAAVAPGDYPITIVATDVDGFPIASNVDGMIRVLAPGKTPDAGSGADAGPATDGEMPPSGIDGGTDRVPAVPSGGCSCRATGAAPARLPAGIVAMILLLACRRRHRPPPRS